MIGPEGSKYLYSRYFVAIGPPKVYTTVDDRNPAVP